MIEFVFKPSRIVDGKRVRSDCYSGRYAVSKGAKTVTVPLNTPDKEIARKRLRDIVLEKQREQEGMPVEIFRSGKISMKSGITSRSISEIRQGRKTLVSSG